MTSAAFFARQRRLRNQQGQRMQISQFMLRASRLLRFLQLQGLQFPDRVRQLFPAPQNPHFPPHHIADLGERLACR